MAKLKYFTKGKGNPATLFLRFYNGRKFDLKKSTSLVIDSEYWNNNKGEVKAIAKFTEKQNLKNKLNGLRTHVLNSYNTDYSNGAVINAHWLEAVINSFFNQNKKTDLNYLLDFTQFVIDNLPTKVRVNGKTGVTINTIKRHQTIKNKIAEFEKEKKTRLKIIDVNLKFYKEFKHFLNVTQKLGINTTGRYLGYIKAICNEAKQQDIKTHPDLEKNEFHLPKEKTTFITLNENEIEAIYNKSFENNYLNNARNWLIIGVWTGARVSDLLRFSSKNVKNGFIEYTSQKTGQKIILPLHWQVKQILDNLNGNFPGQISSQRFNDYIKIVCEETKINDEVIGSKLSELKKGQWRKQKKTFKKWELVSSHICRRSFATIHYGQLPTPVIMAVTGHTTEKMFLKYIGKTAKDNAEALNQFWETQQQKSKREPKMEPIRNTN
tara:strand:- start:3175 stop:4482 length:1308 start_codon:yes stop_codon:yes gene_type:complete